MSQLLAYLTVFVAAAIPWLEVLLVVPAGIIAGLPPVPTVVVGAAGNAATLVPLVIGGDRLRSWYRNRRERRRGRRDQQRSASETDDGRSIATGDRATGARDVGEDEPEAHAGRGRAQRLYDRFGLPGLALLGPLLTGVHVAALVALAAGSPRRPTLVWLLGGVALWAGLAAAATVFGLEAFVDPDALPDLFSEEL